METSQRMKNSTSRESPNAHAVKDTILARQTRIQDLFAGHPVCGSLPEVGVFEEKVHDRSSPHWMKHYSCDDPTEECTENMEDSAGSWGFKFEANQIEPWGKYTHGDVASTSSSSSNDEKEKPKKTVRFLLDSPEAIKPWGKYEEKEEVTEGKKIESKHPSKLPKQVQQQLKDDPSLVIKKQMRKQLFKELLDTSKECVDMQEEHYIKRKEKYGPQVATLTDVPIDERAGKRIERLRLAKERIRREKELEAQQESEKLSKTVVIDRRQKAYEKYLYLGMPNKQKLKERVAKEKGSVSPQDIDLLPFLHGDFAVDIATLTRLQGGKI